MVVRVALLGCPVDTAEEAEPGAAEVADGPEPWVAVNAAEASLVQVRLEGTV